MERPEYNSEGGNRESGLSEGTARIEIKQKEERVPQ